MVKLIDILEREQIFTFDGKEELEGIKELDESHLPPNYSALWNECIKALKEEDTRKVFLWMPLLFKKIVDVSAAELPDQNTLYQHKSLLVEATYRAFCGNYDLALSLMQDGKIPEMFNQTVDYKTDATTWRCSATEYIRKIHTRICSDDWTPDYLVLTGHGSYRPGFMLASELDIGAPLVVRCSMNKLYDMEPALSDFERNIIAEKLKSKQVLVFDEDTVEGVTIDTMADFAGSMGAYVRTAVSVALLGDIRESTLPDYCGHVGDTKKKSSQE